MQINLREDEMYRRFSAFCALLLLVTSMGAAQQKLTLTLEQAIQTGLESSKALRTSEFKALAADAKASETRTASLPSVKFSGAYTRLSDVPPQAVILPANSFGPGFPPSPVNMTLSPTILDNYSLKATLQQPLFTGGKISGAIDAAEESATATKHDVQKDKADVIYNIKAAYWNLYRAYEFKRFVDENVVQMRTHLKDAENLREQGLATSNDVMKVNVQLSDALVRQIDADNAVKLAMYSLNNTLGLPLQTDITLASTIQPTDRSWAPLEQLVKTALDNRPEILAMGARVRAGEAGVSAAHGGWWPQFYLVGDYNYLNPNSRYFPLKREFKDSWDVSLSVSFDVWNWLQTSYQSTQAQAQLSQAREGLSMTQDGVTLEVTQSYLGIAKARERRVVSERGLSQAEENYRITNGKFTQGLVANSELLDAEVALLQAKVNLVQSLVEYELAVAQLVRATAE
jgi:outer membrane protein